MPDAGDGASASIGVQLPILIAPFFAEDEWLDALAATSYIDFYVQPLRRSEPGFDWGIGGLASSAIAGPYVQAGRMRPGGSGWFTTQLVLFPITGELTDGVLYMPSVAFRHRDPGDRTAASFSAGLGLGFQDGGLDSLILLGVARGGYQQRWLEGCADLRCGC
jgi:hypothetical protein